MLDAHFSRHGAPGNGLGPCLVNVRLHLVKTVG
jgi:hypothetical protein